MADTSWLNLSGFKYVFINGSYGVYQGGSPSAPAAPSSPGPAVVATSTGVSPVETQYSLYGHTVPLSVFGVGRIGGEIISGPWIENGLASFIISFGVPADPTGTRTLREIAFDSEVVWDSNNGFSTESFTYRFYGGTLTQGADALETAHFGADAVAYRPQILIAFENLPLANTKFGKIPYVAAVIADAHGDDVNLGEAFERLAYSPWVGFTSDQFETVGITDGLVSGGLIIADQTDFLSLIQSFGRFYPKWNILQTDKLRIVDRGDTVTPDIVLDSSKMTGEVTLSRQEPNSVPSVLELSTIDPDADYTIVPSRAQSPRQPVAVTTSITTDAAYLPVIMDSSTRIALVTYAKHHEDRARKQIAATAMLAGLQIEPGDLMGIANLSPDFPGGETFRVLETLHGANYVVEITAESILQCTVTALTTPPDVGPISPLPELTGLIGWWDTSVADSITTIVDGFGNTELTGLADQSGHGRDLTQTFGGNPPNFSAHAFNSSFPGMSFSGSNLQQLGVTNFPVTGPTLTVFAAVTALNGGSMDTAGRMISYTAPTQTHDYQNVGSFTIQRDGTTSGFTLKRNSIASPDGTLGYATPRRVIATIKSDGTMTVYVDGIASSTATSPGSFVPNGSLSIGGSVFDSSIFGGFFHGVIAEIGVATGYSDATTVGLLDAYLKSRWGM